MSNEVVDARQRVVVAPDVILDPVSFSLNLMAFGREGSRIGIPLAWLWEEIDKIADRYGLISIADLLAAESRGDPCWNDKIWFEPSSLTLGVSEIEKLEKSVTILRCAYESGVVEGIITDYDRWYFEEGDWVGYLRFIIPDYKIVPFDRAMVDTIESISRQATSRKYHINKDKLDGLIKRNKEWSTRTAHEHPVYEHYRRLNIEIGQIFSACLNAYTISSSRSQVRTTIRRRLGKELTPINFSNEDQCMFPFVEAVKLDPNEFTIRDIMQIVQNRKLFNKLGSIRALMERIEEIHKRHELRKNLVTYILGWSPILAIPTQIFQGVQLLKKMMDIEPKPKNSYLYFDVDQWQKDYKRLIKLQQ